MYVVKSKQFIRCLWDKVVIFIYDYSIMPEPFFTITEAFRLNKILAIIF